MQSISSGMNFFSSKVHAERVRGLYVWISTRCILVKIESEGI